MSALQILLARDERDPVASELLPDGCWRALRPGSYDGACDGRSLEGYGGTQGEAIEDLQRQEIEAACDCAVCDGRCGFEPPAMEVETFELTVQITDIEALALAQFVKRVGWSEMRACAVDDDEARAIRSAIDRLRIALREAGFAPR
jgi:hypothetical protein